MAESAKGKRKANFYKGSQQKRAKKNVLEPNMRGFLCSCNNREKDCVYESYNLLNRYADALYGSLEESTAGDVETDLKRELEVLKAGTLCPDTKRFQVVESGAKNVVFIRTTLENPVELAEKIMADVQRTKQQQSRFLIRLVPIEVTCKAYIKDIEKAIEPLLEKYFKNQPRTFSIVFNHRNNGNISRDEVIKVLADKVATTRSDHKVNLTQAELSIIVEVIRGVALLAVVPDFLKYKKYNLHALSSKTSVSSNKSLD